MSSTKRHDLHRDKTMSLNAHGCFMHLLCMLLAVAGSLFLSACSSKGSAARSGSGSIAFTLQTPETKTLRADAAAVMSKAVQSLDCTALGIASVEATVYDQYNNVLTHGGPWSCDAREGLVTGVPAGNSRRIVILLLDASGQTIFQGEGSGITVLQDQIADTGVIPVSSVINHAPVFSSTANQQVTANHLLSFTVTAMDQDSDAVVYSATGLPSGASFNTDTHVFTWTPSVVDAGSHTVTFTATDDRTPPASASMDVTITVIGNHAPVLGNITVPEVFVGNQLQFSIPAATDADGDTLSYEAGDLPSGATFIADPANPNFLRFTWSTQAGDEGKEYKVLFRVTDNGSPRMSDYKWVRFIIRSYQTAPLPPSYPLILDPIGPKQATVGTPLTFTVTSTNNNAPSTITYSIAANTAKGHFPPIGNAASIDSATGAFSWTPASDGNYYLVFSVTDTYYLSTSNVKDSEEVTITVGNVNRPPVLTPIGYRWAVSGQTLTFAVTATDPEKDTLTYSLEAAPTLDAIDISATAQLNPSTHDFTWNASGTAGTDYGVRIRVTDSHGESDFEDVMITIQ